VIVLRVEVPIASFRQSRARDYLETYPVPPPSTVYGMLLSLVGETDRYLHCGVKLAIALTEIPEKSVVTRKVHRFKKKELGHPSNIRPDYQELLTQVEFFVWIDSTAEKTNPNLSTRIEQAFANPSSIDRFGGLCLGESQDLVNSVDFIDSTKIPEHSQKALLWLLQHSMGMLTLPYWVNHTGQQGTLWNRYTVQQLEQNSPIDSAWTEIMSPKVL